ncbi:HEAT repeat domain-containing protein [Bdellovibrionota bacterium FG-2]
MDRRVLAAPLCLFLFVNAPISGWTAPTPAVNPEWISKQIRADLTQRSKSAKSDFDPVLVTWGNKYGTQAVQTLVGIAGNPKESDANRYVSIMGIAKLGGARATSLLVPVLKDKSWMIRNAGLRALSILRDPHATESVVPLLKDPALVVRLEAVSTLVRLDPQNAPLSLVQAIEDPQNYHQGKALWVPSRALRAIESIDKQDPVLVARTSEALAKAMTKVPDSEFRAQIQKSLASLKKKARL